ncbi:MAG TPA: XRE family transcriptional regulator [Candidatus Obscuribacter sp.]|nr:XRE family transcriptional regulator [Candidatus Obscuribacter sp.]MBK9281046.1 XRE family transcriptional regulator [Candidatus Obscuribacter sp.]MBL8083828.1 XRE family transcriptional regulator [Candidatus Obscuribacter sp.]HMW88546.1 XRE family transcriptional regulator [Candidatus Obscuribacter sp.]HMY02342.1 XRE family transcriptional regulator [Candidatus Obscuribacter sp.]
MISYRDYKRKLTPEQRAKVDELARKLIAEEKSLREIRKARECSQAELAKRLGMNQGDLSKFERRTDVYLSTIRHYIEALGGTLELVATFPETGAIRIANFGETLALDKDETQESNAI